MSMLQPICFSSSRYHNVLAAEPLGLPCWGEEGGHCWHWRSWADGGEFGDDGDDHDGGNGSIHFLPHFFSFAIESYIPEADFTLGLSQNIT